MPFATTKKVVEAEQRYVSVRNALFGVKAHFGDGNDLSYYHEEEIG
jgi:hypothetical protein